MCMFTMQYLEHNVSDLFGENDGWSQRILQLPMLALLPSSAMNSIEKVIELRICTFLITPSLHKAHHLC